MGPPLPKPDGRSFLASRARRRPPRRTAVGASLGHVIERAPQGFRGRCDQCTSVSEPVATVDEESARAVLRAIGWSFAGELAYCRRCGTAPASPSSKRKKAERGEP
jgi:hypothetical protein